MNKHHMQIRCHQKSIQRIRCQQSSQNFKEADFHHYSAISARVSTAVRRVFVFWIVTWTWSVEYGVLITFNSGLYYVRTTLLLYPTACPPRRIIISCSRLAARLFTANRARPRAVRPVQLHQRLTTASSTLHRNGRYRHFTFLLH